VKEVNQLRNILSVDNIFERNRYSSTHGRNHFCSKYGVCSFIRNGGKHLTFDVYGPVHFKYIPIYIQQDATLHSLFISGNCSTCFGWSLHPSSEAHTTVSTAPGICHIFTAIWRYRGRVGTGLSVLWVAYATHSTLKPVPTFPR
jgi:hypothetical protein